MNKPKISTIRAVLIRIPARAGLYFNLLEILKQNLSRG